MPSVSVVVIVFNDAARLTTAVRSALIQEADLEVIVVDDASTDETAAVIAELAAADSRIRPIRLTSNSGGCSLPRNTGLAAARGEWVTFLDSDDELAPGALHALHAAATDTGADVVCGLVQRHLPDGTTTDWKPDLHRSGRVTTARELPRVLHDTVAPGKLYRRELLVRHAIEFPLGVLFEDYRFSALVYAHAERIALIPDPVYRWHVALDRSSITQRMHEVESFADRLRGHQLAVAGLLEAGYRDLADELDHKFVSHDLRLYVRHLHARGAAYSTRFRELALPLIERLSPAVLARLSRTDVLVVEGLRAGDLGLVTLAARIHYRGSERAPAAPDRAPGPPLGRRLVVWARAGLRAGRARGH